MSGPQQEYFSHLSAGRLMLQRIVGTSEFVFYPRFVIGQAWEWVAASGRGTVYSRTVVRQRPERGGDYCIAIIELEEGPRMMSRVVGIEPANVEMEMPVYSSIEKPTWQVDDDLVVVFRPVEAG